ncbi:FAD-binding oxidoreductase [Streptomyces malaysiensis]|uniref:FAD-binding oxidoreductase n=1 Tax=Streptomyces malaysiensis TaxID=92644 RepID=UPI00321FC28C|nr:FAD-binding protein [Streptomyces malaysiensis]
MTVPDARSTTADEHAVAELRRLLGGRVVVTDPDILRSHSRDHAPFCEAGTALALVRARTKEDVALTLRAANELRVPVIPQGARTGLAGVANAVDGCVLLSLEKMDRILDISAVDHTAVVQPGVRNAVLSRAVAEQGLFYPPDPSSWEDSTIGGNAATNAGGLCCVKYGVTGDFVRGLEAVLADGTTIRAGRRTAKGVAGYDFTRLLVGSEGTLAVITELTLALRPAAEAALTAVAFFSDVAHACATVTDYMATGVGPSMLELMDEPSIQAVRRYRDLGFPEGAGAMLITQSDRGPRAPEDLRVFAEIAERHGGDALVATDATEAAMLLEGRRSVGYAQELLGSFLSEDVCVPRSRLIELVRGVAVISERHDVLITCTGHAGDGNMHPTVVFDASDPDQVSRARLAFDDVMRLGLDLDGTITGEHGVGLVKRSWLAKELGPRSLALHHGVKRLFDPNGILNPGKVIAPR